MSSAPILQSPLVAETQTFPVLTTAQIDRLRPLAEQRTVDCGDILYRPGEVGVSLYILLSCPCRSGSARHEWRALFRDVPTGHVHGRVGHDRRSEDDRPGPGDRRQVRSWKSDLTRFERSSQETGNWPSCFFERSCSAAYL
jgi:hypothetical protein